MFAVSTLPLLRMVSADDFTSPFHLTPYRLLLQPMPKSQYSTPPPQSTSPPRAPQPSLPSSEPAPASTPPNPPPAASQGSGQASNPPTGPGSVQVTAQAAYAAQQLAMLQQNGYPFPFNPASLNLPPFPPFSGASGHLPGISPAAVSQRCLCWKVCLFGIACINKPECCIRLNWESTMCENT